MDRRLRFVGCPGLGSFESILTLAIETPIPLAMNLNLQRSKRGPRLLACMLIMLAMGAMCASFNGCNWFKHHRRNKKDPIKFKLPPIQLSENAIALEIGVLEIGDDQAEQLEELWGQLDNQMISLDSRKVWDQNGLRAAVVPTQPPALFWQLVDPEIEYATEDERLYHEKLRQSQGKPKQKNVALLQNANLIVGKPHFLKTGPIQSAMKWQVVAGTYRESGECKLAQCHMRITAYHAGDRKVRIRLTPEIKHGEQKPRIAVNEESFFWEPSQDSMTFHEVAIEVPARAGQTVLCGPTTTEGSGLGRQFFRSPNSQRILFVRVTGIGGKYLFSDPTDDAPLVTPLD